MGMKEDNNEVTLKTRILSLELLQVIRIIFLFYVHAFMDRCLHTKAADTVK